MPDNKQFTIENISKSFGKETVLDAVSIHSDTNGVIGLLGRNGAGKTTLLRIITGLLKPDAGTIRLGATTTGSDEFNRRVTYLSEQNALYPQYRVGEYLGWIGSVYGIADLRSRLHTVIDQVDLDDLYDQKIGRLSKGMKQRVGLAAALMPDPDLMVLDEPVSGLDPVQILQFRTVIRKLAKEKKIIISSHLMQEIRELCDRIVLLDEHKIKMDASIHEVMSRMAGKRIAIQLNQEGVYEILRSMEWIKRVRQVDKGHYELQPAEHSDIRERLFDLAVENGWKILGMYALSNPLEDLFEVQGNANEISDL